MASSKFWPEVATALEELNARARTILARSWPGWAPAPGAWVRGASQGARSADRVIVSATWHLANDLFPTGQGRWQLRPLCGRGIRIEPDGRPTLVAHGGRFATFDVRDEITADDKECWHCRRASDRRDG